MSERENGYGGPEHVLGEEIDIVRDNLRIEFDKELSAPPGNDMYMAGHALAWHHELGDSGSPAYETVNEIIENRLEAGKYVHPASSLAILLRAAFQREVIFSYGNYTRFQKELPKGYGNFPFKYRDENHQPIEPKDLNYIDVGRDIVHALRFILTDKRVGHAGRESFVNNASNLDVQTNKINRYGALRAPVALAYEILGRPPRIEDWGASGNHGLKSMALHIPQNVREVVQYIDTTSGYLASLPRSERRNLTARLNGLINRKIPLGPSVGVDIWNPMDDYMNHWRKSCSLRGQEWLDKDKEDLYDYLEKSSPANVHFVQANLAHGTPEELKNYKPDFIFMSFVLHQLPESKQTELIEAAKERARWVCILDAVELQTDGGLKFRENFYEEAEPFPIDLIVIDTERSDIGPEVLMQFTDGRCQTARVFKSKIFDKF